MRWSGGVDHACKIAGVLVIAIAARSLLAQNPPREYGLGGEGPVTRQARRRRFRRQCRRRRAFPGGQLGLTGEAQGILRNQARWLNQYPQYTITIEGHADERGTREYNLALGARRAMAVKTFLAQSGVSAARIRTVSYGKERPIAICDAPSCWYAEPPRPDGAERRAARWPSARQLLSRHLEPQFGLKRPGKCVMVRRVRRSVRSADVRVTLTARSLRWLYRLSHGAAERARLYALMAGLLLGLAALPCLAQDDLPPPRRCPRLSRRQAQGTIR